jgi:hypothetical protein
LAKVNQLCCLASFEACSMLTHAAVDLPVACLNHCDRTAAWQSDLDRSVEANRERGTAVAVVLKLPCAPQMREPRVKQPSRAGAPAACG